MRQGQIASWASFVLLIVIGTVITIVTIAHVSSNTAKKSGPGDTALTVLNDNYTNGRFPMSSPYAVRRANNLLFGIQASLAVYNGTVIEPTRGISLSLPLGVESNSAPVIESSDFRGEKMQTGKDLATQAKGSGTTSDGNITIRSTITVDQIYSMRTGVAASFFNPITAPRTLTESLNATTRYQLTTQNVNLTATLTAPKSSSTKSGAPSKARANIMAVLLGGLLFSLLGNGGF